MDSGERQNEENCSLSYSSYSLHLTTLNSEVTTNLRSYQHHDHQLMCLSVVYVFKLPAIAQFLESQLIFLSHRFDTLNPCSPRYFYSYLCYSSGVKLQSRRENIEIEWVFSYCGCAVFCDCFVQKFWIYLIDLW